MGGEKVETSAKAKLPPVFCLEGRSGPRMIPLFHEEKSKKERLQIMILVYRCIFKCKNQVFRYRYRSFVSVCFDLLLTLMRMNIS